MPDTPARQERKPTPAQELVAQIRRPDFQEQVALALPEGTPPARFIRIAATALLENPDIAEADLDSVYNALLKCAGDGLLPDGREAVLVLRKPKGGGRKRAGYMPMIGGFRKIAADHGWVLRTTAVREADAFDYQLGMYPTVDHKVALVEDRGDIVAAYAIARHRDGRVEVEVMTEADLDKVRAKAETQAVWTEWPERMAEKSVGRLLFKRLPLGTLDERAARRVASVLDADALEPGEATAIVYGSAQREPGAIPPASDAPEQAPPVHPEDPPAAPAAFTGEEPAPKAAQDPEPKWATFVLPEDFTAYAGETLATVLELDREYVGWLASEAVADEEVRTLAAQALEATS